jgi:hypothetical protein
MEQGRCGGRRPSERFNENESSSEGAVLTESTANEEQFQAEFANPPSDRRANRSIDSRASVRWFIGNQRFAGLGRSRKRNDRIICIATG